MFWKVPLTMSAAPARARNQRASQRLVEKPNPMMAPLHKIASHVMTRQWRRRSFVQPEVRLRSRVPNGPVEETQPTY